MLYRGWILSVCKPVKNVNNLLFSSSAIQLAINGISSNCCQYSRRVVISPVFLLRFLRSQKAWRGLLAVAVVFVLKYLVAHRGIIPAPSFGAFFLICVERGLLATVPYVVDRLVAVRLHALAATLVFPLACVTKEYLVSLGRYGTWGSVAYTQHDNLALIQVASLTGIWGITLLRRKH